MAYLHFLQAFSFSMTVFPATFKIKPVCYKMKVSVVYIVCVYLAGSFSNWLMF